MTGVLPSTAKDEFFELALAGERTLATRLALDQLERGVPLTSLLADLSGAVQHQVGERWQRAELTSAEEHIVTGVSQATLEALSFYTDKHPSEGTVVVACAEGDWHSLPAQMFAVGLQTEGLNVLFLGASTPAEHVASLLQRRRPDALAVSCNWPMAFLGAGKLATAAHHAGIPVLLGGRSLTARRARALGSDAWADDVTEAGEILRTWRSSPPPPRVPVELPAGAIALEAHADDVAASAFTQLMQTLPVMATYDQTQLARTREDLLFIIRFLAATRLVDDDSVFDECIDWSRELLVARGVPPVALAAGLEVLAPLVGAIDHASGALAHAAAHTVRVSGRSR